MKASNRCIDLIKSFEGCKLTAYKCPAGVWTIGYGHTRNVRQGDVWTQGKADDELQREVDAFANEVSTLTNKIDLEQGMFDALVSFAYNLGTSNLASSTLLRTIRGNKYNYSEIERQFLRWNKAGGKELYGLTKRRQAEFKLYRG